MPTSQEKIKEIEDELARTQYNKHTQKHIGLLKAKLAHLRQSVEAEQAKASGKRGLGFGLRKAGDATVLLIGMPSVGKSTIVNALTNAASPVAEYDFTTLSVVPGMLLYNGARIQVLDIPGIIVGASSGKGHGKEVLSMARSADMLCLILDAGKDYARQAEAVRQELEDAGFRLGQKPPDVRLVKKGTGGIRISWPGGKSGKHGLADETVKEVLREFGVLNAEVVFRKEPTLDELIDLLAGNRVYMPFLVVVNKCDLLPQRAAHAGGDTVFISAKEGKNMDALRRAMWGKLGLMRIYLKRIGKEPDMKEPLIMRPPICVADVSRGIHKEFERGLTHARIWGPSARFPGQSVGPAHELKDGDIVELHVE